MPDLLHTPHHEVPKMPTFFSFPISYLPARHFLSVRIIIFAICVNSAVLTTAQDFQCDDVQVVDLQSDVTLNRVQTFTKDNQSHFLIGGYDGLFFTSHDGQEFRSHDFGGIQLFNGIATNKEPGATSSHSPLYVLYGRNGPEQTFESGSVFVSTDFENWTEIILIPSTAPDNAGEILSVIHGLDDSGNDVWIATGVLHDLPNNIPYVFVSQNGLDWIETPFGEELSNLTHLQFINGRFYGQGGHPHNGPHLAWSEDGTNWTIEPSSGSVTPIAFDSTSGLYLCGLINRQEATILQSTDGTNWTEQNRNNGTFIDITFTGSEFIAAGVILDEINGGFLGIITKSTDGIEWTVKEIPNAYYGSLAVIQTENAQTMLTAGTNNHFESVLSRQTCSNTICSFSVTTSPEIQIQGINPMTITAIPECGVEPYIFSWQDQDQQVIGDSGAIQIQPRLTQTTIFTLVTQDGNQNEAHAAVTIISSGNGNLIDPNGDGLNNLDDLLLLGSEWRSENSAFDADGDGRITVLDLGYVNTEDH